MKYNKEQRLDIGGQIYHSQLSRFEAAEKYDISDQTARDYMRLYRYTNHLPPKRPGRVTAAVKAKRAVRTKDAVLSEIEAMSREEMIQEIFRARVKEARMRRVIEMD